MPTEHPLLWILAGPNGAGKTTYARRHFSDLVAARRFLNADDVARRMSPAEPQRTAFAAAKAVLGRRADLIRRRTSFAIETTLASRTLLQAVQAAKRAGLTVTLTYLFVSNPALWNQRIAQRVMLGGHHIPSDVVIKRYRRSLELLPAFLEVVDSAELFSADAEPQLILRKRGQDVLVHDRSLWEAIRSLGQESSQA